MGFQDRYPIGVNAGHQLVTIPIFSLKGTGFETAVPRKVGPRFEITSCRPCDGSRYPTGSASISDQTKAEGEQVVREVFPQATIVRPSLAYGEDDHFFSRFAAMIRSSTVLPLIGGGATKFQPVFVGDVTAGLLDLLKRPDTVGKTYEFGGPQVYSFRALLQLLLTALNRQRVLIPIPFALAEMQARLLKLLPNPRLTRDQVRLLKTDKVVSGVEPTLGDLGVHPRTLEEFLAAFRDKYS